MSLIYRIDILLTAFHISSGRVGLLVWDYNHVTLHIELNGVLIIDMHGIHWLFFFQ